MLTDCTISGNTSQRNGGGLSNVVAQLIMTNCTVSGNSTVFQGGGMFDKGGSTTLINCTITGNRANTGGGLWTNLTTKPCLTAPSAATPPRDAESAASLAMESHSR